MDAHAARVKPVATKVNSIIGGTATGTDKKMVGTLDLALRDLAGASAQLRQAARTAEQLAQQATARALAAREGKATHHAARRR